ncbi:helicase-related protein [Aureibacillus halotolerans]|uniref:DNA 3'-5' helicase n=1 Tax=Aureibacillus halotolerans TaxID=1508390 RepID=A0A4R6TPG0_9BACI|nr:helicase-related protein [Aureibacillus halotolerans]TDQ32147.1 ATP-dependent DNA helicase RecQ [Aureibacillus halotolerans]
MLKNIFLKEFQKLRDRYANEIKITFVFKGFPHDWLQMLEQDKLFPIALGTPLHELNNQRQNLIVQFVTTILEGNNKWLTFEEFATIPSDNFQSFTKTIIINNNLFDSYYPLEYRIPPHHIELFQREEKSDQYLENDYLNDYYSSIELSNNGNCFVSYIDEEKYEQVSLFSNSEVQLEYDSIDANVPFVEIGAEMALDFYDLLSNLQKDLPKEIYLSWIDHKTANYTAQVNLDKIHVLKNYFPELKIYRVLKVVPEQLISPEREHAYLDILKRYWGYNSYRNLRVYKNVDSLTDKKETENISQMQIIDSIVMQADQAKGNKDVPDFRDVFVTAPTGAGKSVMFQVPAIYLAEKYNFLTIVISPLIGLMKDQVYNLQEKNVTFSGTINSEISPMEKANIAQRIADKEISILYISPETLLSRAEITALIGDREIGLFVIDEAHIVTTWGKAFRADYWYLGDYLQKIRRGIQYKNGKMIEETTSKHRFPIATFTATAIYGGIEDMYAETRDSLLLNNPINYFGYVKRDNIHMNINKVEKESSTDNEYLKIKHTLLLKNIEFELSHGRKVLIYFPLVKSIFNFKNFLERYADQSITDKVSEYYGRLKKEEKNESFLRFKDGNSKVMLATKAFGMGIDIPDIDTVIHFAPTGNVCDYVQEIGRAARDPEKVGQASFSFLKEDFKHVNRLHGISTLRKSQLIQVMQKVLDLYKQRSGQKNARHLLVSAEEFHYIFQGKKDDTGSVNSDQLDNQLKTALLIIEKGFINSPLKYSPIVARPRSIFTVDYFKVLNEQENLLNQRYGKYIEKHCELIGERYSSVYKVFLDAMWKDLYSHLSFPNFKRLLHEKAYELNNKILTHLDSIFIINLKLNNRFQAQFLRDLESSLEKLNKIFSTYIIKRKVFTTGDIEGNLVKTLNFSSYKAESFVIQLLESITQYENIMNSSSTQRTNILIKNEYRNKTSYKILPALSGFTKFILNEVKKILHNSKEVNQVNYLEYFIRKQDKIGTAKLFLVLGMLEMMDLALYEVKGGDHPQIYIRVGSQYQIEKVLNAPKSYKNSILENVHERHNTSVEMLKFLFENEKMETDEFWNYIEEYFLGELPKEVEQALEKRKTERIERYRKKSSGASGTLT